MHITAALPLPVASADMAAFAVYGLRDGGTTDYHSELVGWLEESPTGGEIGRPDDKTGQKID